MTDKTVEVSSEYLRALELMAESGPMNRLGRHKYREARRTIIEEGYQLIDPEQDTFRPPDTR